MANADQTVETPQPVDQTIKTHPNARVLFIDGSSALSGSGVGIVVLKTPNEALIEQTI